MCQPLLSMNYNAKNHSSLNDALCWANSNTSLLIKAFTLVAGVWIDIIDIVTGRDSICRAFWLTGCTIGAFFGNVKCHVTFSLKRLIQEKIVNLKRTLSYNQDDNIKLFFA